MNFHMFMRNFFVIPFPKSMTELFIADQLRSAESVSKQNIASRVGEGFGTTCMKIGIMIAMAAVIGRVPYA